MKTKVAVVDDNKEFLEELSCLLEANGYEVSRFCAGAEAVEKIPRIKPDAVLLDLNMPRISGFEVAVRLRYFSATSTVPVISMTGYYDEERYAPLLKACGVKICLVKPFSPDEMFAVLKNALPEKKK